MIKYMIQFTASFQEGKYKVEKVPVKDLTLEEIRKKNVDFARTDIGMYYQIFSSHYIFKINTKTNFRKILLTSSKGIEETV